MHILWQGQLLISSEKFPLLTPCPGLRKTYSSRHLELQLVQKGHSWRCMDRLNNCCSHCSQVSSSGISDPNTYLKNTPQVPFVGCGRSRRHRGPALSSSSCYFPVPHKITEYDPHDSISLAIATVIHLFLMVRASEIGPGENS